MPDPHNLKVYKMALALGAGAEALSKATAYLDLYQQKALPKIVETASGRKFMSRIISMIAKF